MKTIIQLLLSFIVNELISLTQFGQGSKFCNSFFAVLVAVFPLSPRFLKFLGHLVFRFGFVIVLMVQVHQRECFGWN